MIKKPRGTSDLIGSEYKFHQDVIQIIVDIVETSGYTGVKTPLFESLPLYTHSVGDASDIVTKEMYQFTDKKKRPLALRPEGTAGVARAYAESKTYGQESETKWYYYGEYYRYERPQEGRKREFHQFGIEHFAPKNPLQDAEVLIITHQILENFLPANSYTLIINFLGSKSTRENYKQDLVIALNKINDLCLDCQHRLQQNPLRVLDCKVCWVKFDNLPNISDYLAEDEKTYQSQVTNLLDAIPIPYQINPKLVRGLDYYDDLIFEFIYTSDKSQNAVIGGGRYNNLLAKFDIQQQGIGFAIGIERLKLLIKSQNPEVLDQYAKTIDLYFMPQNESEVPYLLTKVLELREAGLICEIDLKWFNHKKQYRQALKLKAIFAIEKENQKLKVKNINTKEETVCDVPQFLENFTNHSSKNSS